MDFKISKIEKLFSTSNDMEGNVYFYAVYLKIDVPNKPGYIWRRKFVLSFTGEDIQEYLEQDSYTVSDINQLKKEYAYSWAESFCYGDDIKEITKQCNETIDRYNKRIQWNNSCIFHAPSPAF